MSRKTRVIASGPLKGKKITFAATEQVEALAEIADEFMAELFDLHPGEYLISDESSLRDFTDFGNSDTSALWHRIDELHGINATLVGSERLVRIFSEISLRRRMQ